MENKKFKVGDIIVSKLLENDYYVVIQYRPTPKFESASDGVIYNYVLKSLVHEGFFFLDRETIELTYELAPESIRVLYGGTCDSQS